MDQKRNKKINIATMATTFAAATVFNYSALAAETIKPDNSARNAKIEAHNLLNAQDQGTSDYDIKMTQTIRQQIIDQKGFSTNAKNIKIITRDGVVVLKGPVNTLAEKNKIESIAANAAGKTKVSSQITVTH